LPQQTKSKHYDNNKKKKQFKKVHKGTWEKGQKKHESSSCTIEDHRSGALQAAVS